MKQPKYCVICGKLIESSRAKYCSVECRQQGMRKYQFVKHYCLYCDKELTYNQIRGHNKFCSSECNYKYKLNQRKSKIKLYNCIICGKSLSLDQCSHNVKTCSAKCAYKYRIQLYGEQLTKHNYTEEFKEKMSLHLKQQWKNPKFRETVVTRMKTNNPSFQQSSIDKCRNTREKNGTLHIWAGERGGNGKITKAEKLIYDFCIDNGFLYNKAITTTSIKNQYPNEHYGFNYKPDFVNINLKLCIEIDGESHLSVHQKMLDAKKETCLSLLGYKTIRFTNEQVFNDIDTVKQIIIETIKECNFING